MAIADDDLARGGPQRARRRAAEVRERDERARRDRAVRVLPGLADVDEEDLLARGDARGEVLDADLGRGSLGHETRDTGSPMRPSSPHDYTRPRRDRLRLRARRAARILAPLAAPAP